MSIMVRVFGQMLFFSMVARVYDQRLFHEHDNASFWSETIS